MPVLDDALAWFTCSLKDMLPGGDHAIGVGAVLDMGHAEDDGDPLLWFRGGYRGLVGG